MENPLVSCVCVTGKTEEATRRFLPGAVQSFMDQTYDNKELVVVYDCPDSWIALPGMEGSYIKWVKQPKQVLGALRNSGLAAARGQLVCQWDSDDWHHPDRLKLQVSHHIQSGGLPTFLEWQLAYDWTTNTASSRYLGYTYIHGTILHAKPCQPYPEVEREEDTEFQRQWPKQQVIIEHDPAIYVRFFHGENTWHRKQVLKQYHGPWAQGHWHLSDPHRRLLNAVLSYYKTWGQAEHRHLMEVVQGERLRSRQVYQPATQETGPREPTMLRL